MDSWRDYIFICILYSASYIQPLIYVLLTLHEIPKFGLIFLCVSKTFQYQEIRWRFSILRSVTLCVLELTCPVFGVRWLHKKKLFNFALHSGKFTNTSSKINSQLYHIAQNTKVSPSFLVEKLCGNAQSFKEFAQHYAETVHFPKTYMPGN